MINLDLSTLSKYIILAVWAISVLRATTVISYIWQLKEYRWDRMLDFLGSKKGRKTIYSPYNLYNFILIFVVAGHLWDPTNKLHDLIVIAALLFLGLINFWRVAYNVFNKTLARPKPTLKMILILLSTLLFESLLLYLTDITAITVIFLEILRPIFISLIVMLVGIPFLFVKKYLIYKATEKRANMPDLKVIGITGSYGKSSTKEFLFKILEQKFKVAKTPSHVNVDIGIAQTMLKQVNPEHELFIVEMGAYKPGEIKSSCDIVKPDIGIITGINEQHLSLFGNIETTIKAKGELFASLATEGVAIVNGDSPYAMRALKYNNASKAIEYGVDDKHEVRATNVKQKKNVITFTAHVGHKRADFEVPVFGIHYVQNILACVACGLELGLSLKEIAEYAKSCEILGGSLEIFDGKKGSIIVDDSYNSNPDGFIAALNAVKKLNPKKLVLVTPGMMELGIKSEEIHRRVGQHIADLCDVVLISSEDSYEILSSTIYECSEKTEVLFHTDHQKIIKAIKSYLAKGNIILFENRVPQIVIDSLKSKS